MTSNSAGRRFRDALAAERPLQIPGAINANHALLARHAGDVGSTAKMWQPQLLLWALLGIAMAVIIMYMK